MYCAKIKCLTLKEIIVAYRFLKKTIEYHENQLAVMAENISVYSTYFDKHLSKNLTVSGCLDFHASECVLQKILDST